MFSYFKRVIVVDVEDVSELCDPFLHEHLRIVISELLEQSVHLVSGEAIICRVLEKRSIRFLIFSMKLDSVQNAECVWRVERTREEVVDQRSSR